MPMHVHINNTNCEIMPRRSVCARLKRDNTVYSLWNHVMHKFFSAFICASCASTTIWVEGAVGEIHFVGEVFTVSN